MIILLLLPKEALIKWANFTLAAEESEKWQTQVDGQSGTNIEKLIYSRHKRSIPASWWLDEAQR